MATFHVQVEGLTSLAIDGSSTPTEDELSQFLVDGVLDITTKWLLISPADMGLFTIESSETTSNGSLTILGNIISVVREAGTSNDWRNCTYIPNTLQSRVTDVNSIYYATKYHPVYTTLDNGTISVFPAPGSDPDQFKVYYINDTPVNSSGAALEHSHSDVKYFPKKLVPLVVKYAAIKSLEAKISTYTIDDEDSELVTSLSNSYNALKADYDQIFGLAAQEVMNTQRQEATREQVPVNQRGEEE